jgi:hypothetical protein
MRPSAHLIERFADTLVQRLAKAEFAEVTAPEAVLKARIARLLTENFDQEAAIENDARAKAEELVRKGAPGVRRDELDLRRVEQLMKQRIAKERGFVL